MGIESQHQEKVEAAGNAYLESFGITWEFLRNKKVLDVGGSDGAFAVAAKQYGVDVTTLEQSARLFFTKGISDQAPYVEGDVYNLPFGSETFDFVCARYLAPFRTVREPNAIQKYMTEVMRVVKALGEFRVVPAPFRDSTEGITKEVPIEFLESLGLNVEVVMGTDDAFYIFRK